MAKISKSKLHISHIHLLVCFPAGITVGLIPAVNHSFQVLHFKALKLHSFSVKSNVCIYQENLHYFMYIQNIVGRIKILNFI